MIRVVKMSLVRLQTPVDGFDFGLSELVFLSDQTPNHDFRVPTTCFGLVRCLDLQHSALGTRPASPKDLRRSTMNDRRVAAFHSQTCSYLNSYPREVGERAVRSESREQEDKKNTLNLTHKHA